MSKHTPGPWTVTTKSIINRIFGYPEVYIAEINFRSNRPGEKKANAHLIAAAPAMYEALQHALGVCEGEAELRGDSDSDDYLGGAAAPVAQMIRTALAQADGK